MYGEFYSTQINLMILQVSKSVEVEGDHIISIEYMFDDECVLIVTSNGDFFEWRLNDGSLECVGTMESGIACVKWSSDQEVCALVTGLEMST